MYPSKKSTTMAVVLRATHTCRYCLTVSFNSECTNPNCNGEPKFDDWICVRNMKKNYNFDMYYRWGIRPPKRSKSSTYVPVESMDSNVCIDCLNKEIECRCKKCKKCCMCYNLKFCSFCYEPTGEDYHCNYCFGDPNYEYHGCPSEDSWENTCYNCGDTYCRDEECCYYNEEEEKRFQEQMRNLPDYDTY